MNADALRQISWQDWRPFRLPLADGELDVRDCLRLLPGKRMACRAIHDGEEVFAKLCFAPDHRRAIAGEASNLGRLADAGVRVPSVRGVVEQPGISVLLLEWLPDARPLADIAVDDWPGALAADFCHQLDSMLAANLIQDDLHLGNFLSAGDGLYVVDAGDIAALEKVSVGRRRDNLALLCAQAPLPDQARLTALVLAHLGGHIDSESRLRDAIQTKLLQRIRHANGKWLRDCSAVALVAQAQATIHLDRTLDPAARETVMSLLDHPEQADTLKQGSRITVYRQANWIIKHYRQASLKMQVKQALGIHPAQRSWRFGWTWHLLGLPTPRPVGLKRCRDGSAVIVFPFQPGERYSEVLEYHRQEGNRIRPALEQDLARMGQAQLWHGDVKAQNILVAGEHTVWIDLDSAGWSRWPARARRHHRKDVLRFAHNWTQFVDRSGEVDTRARTGEE